MSAAPAPIAFLDASVLYPALLRNILMHFAVNDLFQPRWSARVHEEWMLALIRNRPDISRAQLERTRLLMETYAQGSLVENYERRIESIVLPDPQDRHVLAAAVHSGSQVIVTANLRHFPADVLATSGIMAQHPDAFLLRLLKEDAHNGLAAFHDLCLNRRRPEQTPQAVLDLLQRQGLIATASALRALTR